MSLYQTLPHTVALNTPAAFHAPTQRFTSVLARLHTVFTVARTRRALAHMDARQLADIGLTQAQAQAEAKRSFWDAAPQCQH